MIEFKTSKRLGEKQVLMTFAMLCKGHGQPDHRYQGSGKLYAQMLVACLT